MKIEYHKETKELFKQFLEPTTVSDYGRFEKYYFVYENNIKQFIKEQLNIDIDVYFQKVNNILIYFYIIEGCDEIYTSDEIEENNMFSYNEALNNAIKYIFKNIYF